MVRLFAMTCGWIEADYHGFLEHEPGRLRVPVPCYLIDHPRGKVVFDTGLHVAIQSDPAARLGIPFAGPAPYPADPDLLALRVGALAAVEGWCPEYSKATFRAWFLERKASGLPDNVAAVLAGLGKPSRETMSVTTLIESPSL